MKPSTALLLGGSPTTQTTVFSTDDRCSADVERRVVGGGPGFVRLDVGHRGAGFIRSRRARGPGFVRRACSGSSATVAAPSESGVFSMWSDEARLRPTPSVAGRALLS